jgi:anti-sigma factor RsiW
MTCQKYRASIDAELHGELPAAEMEARQSHTAACPDCAAEALREQQLSSLLRGWADAEAPRLLAERALAQCVFEPRAASRELFRWRWRAAGALIAASAAAGLWLTRPSTQSVSGGPTPEEIAQAHRAVSVLRRVGAHVARAEDHSMSALERVIRLTGSKEIAP